MEHSHSENTLENTIKHSSLFVKKIFERAHKYFWFSWWIILGLIVFIVFLVIHYQNKISNIESSRVIYYQNPYRINYRTSIFDDFDRYFDRQNKYFNDLFEEQERSFKKYSDLFDSNKWTIDTSNKSQQTYQKYYLNDWKVYSYKINYNNWVVDWNLMIDDVVKKDTLMKKIQELGLDLSGADSNIIFSWKINNINSLINILD